MTKAKLLSGLAALMIGAPTAAHAQSMDYEALEMLFGEPVTTSATGKPQRASEAPVPMEILTAEQIRRTGATNIPDALRHVLGVDVVRWTTEGADVSTRGLNSPFNPRMLVLVNGRQVYADHFGMVFWNAIPVQMSEIRQIEVIKGPNTALFGFNAAIGVINIVTYNPLYDDVNEARVIYGTQNTKEITGVVTKRFGDVGGISLSGSYFDAEAFDGGPVPRQIPQVDPSTSAFNLRGQFRADEKSEVGFEASWSSTERAAFVPIFSGSTPDVETWSLRGSYLRDSKIGNLKANAYYNFLDHETVVVGFGALNYENEIFVAQVEDLFKVGTDHAFRIFGEYRHNIYRGEFPLNPIGEGVKASFDSFAASAMWDWQINDALNFVGTVRLDYVDFQRNGFTVPGVPISNDDFNVSVTEYTYNAGLTYRLDDLTRLKFSTARGAKLMSLIEFATVGAGPAPIPGFTFILLGNPDLGAGIAESYNIGFSRDVPSLFSTFEADVFYTSLSKTPTVANVAPQFIAPPFVVGQPGDAGETEEFGIEVEITGEKDNLRWGANYAFLNVNDKFDLFAMGNSPLAVEFERSTPKHRFNINGGVTWGKLELDLYGQYFSSTQRIINTGPTGFALTPVNDVFTLSGRLAYQVTDYLEISVSGVAFNKNNFQVSQSDPVERQIYGMATFRW